MSENTVKVNEVLEDLKLLDMMADEYLQSLNNKSDSTSTDEDINKLF